MSHDDEDTGRHSKRARERASRETRHVEVLPETPTSGLLAISEDWTSPVDLIERELSESTREAARRAHRDTDAPATVGMLMAVAEKLNEERSGIRERERALESLLQSPHEVAARLERRIRTAERTIAWTRKVLIGAVMAAAGSFATVAFKALEHAERGGMDAQRLIQLEQGQQRCEGDIRDLRIQLGRRSELTDHRGWPSLPATSNKEP